MRIFNQKRQLIQCSNRDLRHLAKANRFYYSFWGFCSIYVFWMLWTNLFFCLSISSTDSSNLTLKPWKNLLSILCIECREKRSVSFEFNHSGSAIMPIHTTVVNHENRKKKLKKKRVKLHLFVQFFFFRWATLQVLKYLWLRIVGTRFALHANNV